ncbi:ABC transporter substrate-binding protein [Rhodobacter maris]|uniref:Peptide/nickel transport system substrate-binding protein n=1 Tax=Rhodobacter maris TaxID=446682 RepID=A0A285T1S2_9RHOB|nr:ABC transporter substrate-binding protein [Rhodobacter maris]SOC15267.1 peptide/nickel transport system substrate-binding protein [Rhodobacter maris]
MIPKLSPERVARRAATALALAALAGFGPTLAQAEGDHRGGTLRLVSVSSQGTLDPHINYTSQFWQLYAFLYDGLVGFKKVGGADSKEVVPDLAEAMPVISNDGKTYTFTLRKGIKFSDGSDMTATDVLASFQRIFKVLGPTAGTFYNGIVGADTCLAEPAGCTLDGGVIIDEAAGTVTINLTAADPEFLFKLSAPHASILPSETTPKDNGNEPIPGTGAYMVKSYDANNSMVIVRNPAFKEWSKDAQPDGYVDEIDYTFGGTEEAAVNAIMNGQADWMFDTPPADRLAELSTTAPDQIHLSPLAAWWYAPMNVNLAPFDDVRVRQALNYAIDRDALVSLFGGPALAQPVCQVLPPEFPGHEDQCIYTQDPGTSWSAPDMEKAQALVDESGTKGAKITVVTEDNAASRGIGTYLQSVLSDLGYDAAVQTISGDIQFTYIQNTNNKVQLSISQWYADYPAASNFLNVLFGCDSFHPGSDASINISGMCDQEIDARMKAAIALGATDQAAADKDWAKIDAAVMEKSPALPLFTPQQVDLLSTRVGNYQFSSLHHWLIANAWVQ